ncbi:hypothetical protein DRJ00_08035 [Candidatus Aerophobetes bacterium]|uniref:Uncharacterized protein n=1 Tax=Aerophobetes bacterium TaxID=2030807 RepID=A0A497E1T9_UNCAE|nr:MAG: hypothetical protein DRJ00_08035 [Candidatus Aerophobetes bacterium]
MELFKKRLLGRDREISKARGFEGLREGKNEVNFNFNKCNGDRCLVSSSAIAGVGKAVLLAILVLLMVR